MSQLGPASLESYYEHHYPLLATPMKGIYLKEIQSFFSSLTGYVVVALFLLFLGLLLWILPDSNILDYGAASLEYFFLQVPLVFLFLIPAVTMRSLAEERQSGTLELLATKPLTDLDIVLGKFLAAWTLVVIALVPTLLYYYTIYRLGSPMGNIDTGATAGSYIGLVLLGGAMASIGIFTSSLTSNQIVSFLLAAAVCTFCLYGFDAVSGLPTFYGHTDYIVSGLGLNAHYQSVSRGVLELRDILYFASFMAIFVIFTQASLARRKW